MKYDGGDDDVDLCTKYLGVKAGAFSRRILLLNTYLTKNVIAFCIVVCNNNGTVIIYGSIL